MNQMAAHLVEEVLPRVGVRQWVLSFPFSVRYLLAYNPNLTTKILRIYIRTIGQWYRRKAKALGIRNAETGAITFIQRFGSAINLNVHFHTLFLDGVFFKTSQKYKFRTLAPPTDQEVAALVKKLGQKILSLLEKNDLGPDSQAEDTLSAEEPLLAKLGAASIQSQIALGDRAGQRVRRIGMEDSIGEIYKRGKRCAVCDGFSLHANVAIPSHARHKIEKLCRYIARPPISQERLSERPDGKLLYKLKTTYSDGTTHVLFDPLELVEKLIAIIPPPRANLLRYHGVLAPNSKVRSEIVPKAKNTNPTQTTRSKNYRRSELMKKVFGIDVLKCPRCGKMMKVISTLLDESVVKPFLRNIKQPDEPVVTENSILLKSHEVLQTVDCTKPVGKQRLMYTIFSLLLDLFKTRRQLVLENAFLRQQLVVASRKQKRFLFGRWDRLILVWLSKGIKQWKKVFLIAQPETLIRWHRKGFNLIWGWKSGPGGRPRVTQENIRLIRKISSENSLWGAHRVQSELQKLGVRLALSTVQKYMTRKDGPRQGWRTFLKNHAKDIVAIDTFTVPTFRFQQLWALVILSHNRRKILGVAATYRPSSTWVMQQIREAFTFRDFPKYIVHDRDQNLKSINVSGVEEIITEPCSPWQNGYAERLIGSIRRECTDHFIVFGRAHLTRILKSYASYYNRWRTHLSLNCDTPEGRKVEQKGRIYTQEVLNGLHHFYERKVA